MAVLIKDSRNSLKTDIKRIGRKAQKVLNDLGFPDAELSVLITDDAKISSLNKKYFHKEGPTNVIAFPMYEDVSKADEIAGILALGDVVISADTAKRESEIGLIGFEERLVELLVHGILHLVGYDHETCEEDAAVMEAKTVELLDSFAEEAES